MKHIPVYQKPQVKPQKVYDNRCAYEMQRDTDGFTKVNRCKNLTGVNRFFCPSHFKLVGSEGL